MSRWDGGVDENGVMDTLDLPCVVVQARNGAPASTMRKGVSSFVSLCKRKGKRQGVSVHTKTREETRLKQASCWYRIVNFERKNLVS